MIFGLLDFELWSHFLVVYRLWLLEWSVPELSEVPITNGFKIKKRFLFFFSPFLFFKPLPSYWRTWILQHWSVLFMCVDPANGRGSAHWLWDSPMYLFRMCIPQRQSLCTLLRISLQTIYIPVQIIKDNILKHYLRENNKTIPVQICVVVSVTTINV